MSVSPDKAMLITEHGLFFDRIETFLRELGQIETADRLLKLQQDAGIEVQKHFGVYDPFAGPQTAALDKAYQEVTVERIQGVFKELIAFDTRSLQGIGTGLLNRLQEDLIAPEGKHRISPDSHKPLSM